MPPVWTPCSPNGHGCVALNHRAISSPEYHPGRRCSRAILGGHFEPNLAIMAQYVQSDDVIVDVGGGAGRLSLPLALCCHEVINVDPSAAMLAGFEATASEAGISNVRSILGDWLEIEPPRGTFALVNHVTYLTREIVPFVEKLEAVASRRVLITVNSPPLPSRHRELFRLLYHEEEEIVPGPIELVNVLWELGIEPDVRMLPAPGTVLAPVPGLGGCHRSDHLAVRHRAMGALAARPGTGDAAARGAGGALR